MRREFQVRFCEGPGVRFPRATRLVICCRRQADEALEAIRHLMKRLKLTVNETKTRVCRLPEDHFDFLGYTIGRCYSPKTGRAYFGTRPSKKSVQRLCREISRLTSRRCLLASAEEQVQRLNRSLTGWSNYFCLGPVSKAYRAVDRHACRRFRQWLCSKHKVQGRGGSRYLDEKLYQEYHLVNLRERTHSFPWAKA